MLNRANQALSTLERYQSRLDTVQAGLSALEVEDLVTLRDVVTVLQRTEMVRRIAEEISLTIIELGEDGRLVHLQLEELMGGVADDRRLVIRDYFHEDPEFHLEEALGALAELDTDDLLDLKSVAASLHLGSTGHDLDVGLQPRGYRLLVRRSHACRRPSSIGSSSGSPTCRRSCGRRSTTSTTWRAWARARARAIKEGLSRLAETSILDRYSVTERDRAHAVAARFHARWLTLLRDQPGNPCGVEIRWFADDLVATIAVAEPELRWVQHVAGFSEHHIALLDDILGWYADRDVPCRFEACDEAAGAALVARGAADAGPIDLLVGPPLAGSIVAAVGIEQVGPDRGDEFAALLLAGHEIDGPAAPHLGAIAGFTGSAGMECWIATVDDAPTGAAALVVDDGVGYLANAATTPDGRGRGVQTALIGTRIAAAIAQGCDLVASLAIPEKPSHRNLKRAGLRPIEHRRMLHVG